MMLLLSCNTTSIVNLDNEILPAKLNGQPYTQQEVRAGILRACNRRGWSAQPQEDGTILASIIVRGHSAKVQIQYTTRTVSISYADSERLHHWGNRIHRNYNRWVMNLYHSIQTEFGSRGQMY